MQHAKSQVLSSEDARRLARRRLPRLVFDFVEGAAGCENGAARNTSHFENILLQPRVMADLADRSLKTPLLGQTHDIPFGIAPMGMCNLAHPAADRSMATLAKQMGFPICLSSAASTSIEDMARMAGAQAWFQLYFHGSVDHSLALVERARAAGYQTLVLTVDVPLVSRRLRDLRNGFSVPFRMTPRAFLDFALHPRWSLATLAAGAPKPMNFLDRTGASHFDRDANRSGADWSFLQVLRDAWPGNLIVKGVTSPGDARRIRSLGADALYVSNHGGRQLDSVPAAIGLLPLIRDAVGRDLPIVFDSGVRSGEDIVKALALGADFVMIGRPALYALGAEGPRGLQALFECLAQDVSLAMAQLGVASITQITPSTIFNAPIATPSTTTANQAQPAPRTGAATRADSALQIATKS